MNTDDHDRHVLPPLLTGRRRWWFTGLILAGLVQAGAAAVTVLAVRRGLSQGTRAAELTAFLTLALAAIGLGWTRSRERVLAEQLGQDYTQEIRLRLVRAALDGSRSSSLGATLTRASNDLSAIRNWVAQGTSPIAVGIPLLLGCTLVLAAIHPLLALGVLVPLLVLGAVLLWESRAAYARSRRVRRERGRLAGHLADTLTATVAIRSAGGSNREMKRLATRSGKVVQAAVDRARVLGRIRGAATAATGIATATMIGCGMVAGLSGSNLAAALTVVGLLSGPVQDLGRVVEYRQTFRAARAAIGPALSGREPTAVNPPADLDEGSVGVDAQASEGTGDPTNIDGHVELAVQGVRVGTVPGVLPALHAREGDRIVVASRDRATTAAVLAVLVGLDRPVAGQITVSGRDILAWPSRERRKLVGFAAQGMRLERTTIRRAVRYRHPEAVDRSVDELLSQVGLGERVSALPDAENTLLRNGGEPLTTPDRARLLLARAVLGHPRLLVLDHLDAELGPGGRAMLRDLLHTYPGIVVLASDHPEALTSVDRYWNLDATSAASPGVAQPIRYASHLAV
jgi:ABC-type multidrug transport system fused ATPase/permease subunit